MSSRWPDEQTLLRRQHFYIKALRSSTMRILNVGDGQSWHDIQVLSGPRSYQVYTWRESAGLRILKGAHRLSRNMPKRTGRPRASFLSRKSQSLHSTLPESACCLAQVWTSPASRRLQLRLQRPIPEVGLCGGPRAETQLRPCHLPFPRRMALNFRDVVEAEHAWCVVGNLRQPLTAE